jgi:hypothetical protein
VHQVGLSLGALEFEHRQDLGEYQIWDLISDNSPVQVIPEDRALVVGTGLPPLLMTFPFAQQASQPYLSLLDDQIFDDHPLMILSQFEDTTLELDEAEERLSDYLQSGGTVVLDLSGMETTLGRSTDVFDVDVLRLAVAGEVRVRWQDGLSEDLSQVLSLTSIAPEGWSGAVYENLDVVLAEIQYLGEWYPILGYRQVGQGRAWFVGMNLLYYAQLSGDRAIPQVLRDLSLEGVQVNQEIVYQPVPVEDWFVDDRGLRIDYTSTQEIPAALISYTYSPRWQITIDGRPVEFSAFENLIQLSLPSGRHQIGIAYQAYGTSWPILGLGVGLFGAASLIALLLVERAKFQVGTPAEQEAVPEIATMEYTPCGHCGFRLAESRPPTAITYPFQVVSCPICGDSITDEGFQPGRELTPDQLRMAVSNWLKEQEFLPIIEGVPLVRIPGDFFVANGGTASTTSQETQKTVDMGSQGDVE